MQCNPEKCAILLCLIARLARVPVQIGRFQVVGCKPPVTFTHYVTQTYPKGHPLVRISSPVDIVIIMYRLLFAVIIISFPVDLVNQSRVLFFRVDLHQLSAFPLAVIFGRKPSHRRLLHKATINREVMRSILILLLT